MSADSSLDLWTPGDFETQWLPRPQRFGQPQAGGALDPGHLWELFSLGLYGTRSPPADQNLLRLIPHFHLLKDAEKAAQLLADALLSQRPVIIFGDYDVDGTTSVALLKRYFTDLGFSAHVYIPERLVEGYGLNVTGLRNILENFSESLKQGTPPLVITVDNGIAAIEACEKAQQWGIEVIITDHHDLGPTLPSAAAVVNPKQHDCLFPYKMLAGAGVAFYVMIALRAKLKSISYLPAESVTLRSYLDLVAIGTIADVAPMDGVNHVLCRTGLRVLDEHLRKGTRPGIRALLKTAGWQEGTPLTATTVGFQLGPRLNAAGRLGNAHAAAELLWTEDLALAEHHAQHLQSENAARRDLEKSMTEAALVMASDMRQSCARRGEPEPLAWVLAHDDWHTGVVGIVASRVVERTHRPTLVLGKQGALFKGSGRSIPGFHLFQAVSLIRSQLKAFGGHHHAIGLSLEPQLLPLLREHLHAQMQQTFPQGTPSPTAYYDALIDLSYCHEEFTVLFERFEPFGAEHPKPIWRIDKVNILSVKVLGSAGESTHAKVLCGDDSGCQVWMLAFGRRALFESVAGTHVSLDLLIEAKTSYWQGKRRPEFRVVDVKLRKHANDSRPKNPIFPRPLVGPTGEETPGAQRF